MFVLKAADKFGSSFKLFGVYPEFRVYGFVKGNNRADGTLVFVQYFYSYAIALQVTGYQVYLDKAVRFQ
nr:hypothetical protein [Bowmanella yangjiangensis]